MPWICGFSDLAASVWGCLFVFVIGVPILYISLKLVSITTFTKINLRANLQNLIILFMP